MQSLLMQKSLRKPFFQLYGEMKGNFHSFWMESSTFSKIRKDVNYVPNKKTVLAFTIALELSLDEAKDLLASAGFALSRSSKTDIIVAYFLQNKIYDMFELNFKAVGRAISKAKVLPVQ